MAAHPNVPPDLTEAERAFIIQSLDAYLDSGILYSLLNGIYTGIIAVTLWNIFIANKSRPIGRAMVIIIIILHIMTTVNFAFNWSILKSIYVDNGQSFWAEYVFDESPGIPSINLIVGGGITSTSSTILADSIMIWRCWTVWGRRRLVILLPVLFLASAVAFKTIAVYKDYTHKSGPGSPVYNLGFVLSSSFVLATTLWCTLLIIYRIVMVTRRTGDSIGVGIRAYRHVIEVMVESSALYSVSLVLYLVFYSHNAIGVYYCDPIAAIARGITPTLLIGRIAAGHARPDDSWQGSVISGPLRFGSHARGQNSQQDSLPSEDLEAQQEMDNLEYGHRTLADSQKGHAICEVQRERDNISHHSTLAESKEDIAINSKGAIHKEGPEVQQEVDGEYGHRNMLKGSTGDNDIENMVIRDDIQVPKAQFERLADGHFNNNTRADELDHTRPDDDRNEILTVRRD